MYSQGSTSRLVQRLAPIALLGEPRCVTTSLGSNVDSSTPVIDITVWKDDARLNTCVAFLQPSRPIQEALSSG